MQNLATQLFNDEAGFIVSAELILVSTVAVLSLVVGLSEVSHGVNQELGDIGAAFGSMNQSFTVNGLVSQKSGAAGSSFHDHQDLCDSQNDIYSMTPTGGEWN